VYKLAPYLMGIRLLIGESDLFSPAAKGPPRKGSLVELQSGARLRKVCHDKVAQSKMAFV
jgi:hypothetical protein